MSDVNFLLSSFLMATLISFLLTPVMGKIAKRFNIMDIPKRRKVHDKPIPYLGGVSIWAAFMVAILIPCYLFKPELMTGFTLPFIGLLSGGTIIALVGLYDDIKQARPIFRLIIQVGVAVFMFFAGIQITSLTSPWGTEIILGQSLSIILTVFWIVGITNAMNLIDGLDGLASGITFLVALTLCFISLYVKDLRAALLYIVLCGASLGFLKYNFYPAKIFMGDTGSTFIGFILSCIGVIGFGGKTATAMSLIVPIVILAVPIMDTITTIIRRSKKKVSIFKPDRGHIHHRLMNLGFSQRQVVLLLYFMTIYFTLLAFLLVIIPQKFVSLILIVVCLDALIAANVLKFIEEKVGNGKEEISI